jgi:hypothetical protein
MEERKDYLLRGMDPGLWKEFKTACSHYGIPMRATFIKHIQNIVNDYRKDKIGDGDNGVRSLKRRIR